MLVPALERAGLKSIVVQTVGDGFPAMMEKLAPTTKSVVVAVVVVVHTYYELC